MALRSTAHVAKIQFSAVPVDTSGSIATYDGIKAAAHRLAIKFRAPDAISIASVALRLAGAGTTTGITYTVEIQGDSSDAPDGTPLGTASAAQAAPAGGTQRWIDFLSLGSATGNLTQGAPYWIVLKDGGGTTPTGSNYVSIQATGGVNTKDSALAEKGRKYESDWTSVAVSINLFMYVLKDTNGHLYPGAVQNSSSNSSSTVADVYGVNREGIRVCFGSLTTVYGFSLAVGKSNSPAQLDVEVYRNDTLVDTLEFPSATIASTTRFSGVFPTGVVLQPNDYLYLLLHQNGNGGDDWNDYVLQGFSVPTSAPDLTSCLPQNVVHVGMTSADSWASPSASLTVSTGFFPKCELSFGDVNADFDSAASGGLLTHPGMAGGMRG